MAEAAGDAIDRSPTSGRLTLMLFLCLYALAAIPVLSTPIPPLFDYPNHLGRMAILAASGADPALDRYYAIRWSLLPNLAMDAVVPLLAQVMPLREAGRAFVLLVILLLGLGPVILARAWWGAWSPWSCAGFLFVYSRVLLWGFLNYLTGIGIAFLVLAAWIALERASPLRRGAFGAVAVFLVFLCHLEAFGVLALLLFGVEIPKIRGAETSQKRVGRAAALILALLPASLVFLLQWQPHAAGAMALPRLGRKLDLLFSVFDNYSRPFDVACFVALVVALAFALWRGRVTLVTGAAWPLGLLFAAYLALPSTLFTGAGADHRLPLVMFLLLAAAARPALATVTARNLTVCAGVALLLVRLGVIESVWIAAGATYRHDLAILATLPTGSRLAIAVPAGDVAVAAAPIYHLPVLAVATRDAFVPTLFAFASQQPVALQPSWRELAAQSDPNAIWNAFTGNAPGAGVMRRFVVTHYDAIAFVGRSGPGPIVTGCIERLGAFGHFILDRVVDPTTPCVVQTPR